MKETERRAINTYLSNFSGTVRMSNIEEKDVDRAFTPIEYYTNIDHLTMAYFVYKCRKLTVGMNIKGGFRYKQEAKVTLACHKFPNFNKTAKDTLRNMWLEKIKSYLSYQKIIQLCKFMITKIILNKLCTYKLLSVSVIMLYLYIYKDLIGDIIKHFIGIK